MSAYGQFSYLKQYRVGDRAIFNGEHYVVTQTTIAGESPHSNSVKWEKVSTPDRGKTMLGSMNAERV